MCDVSEVAAAVATAAATRLPSPAAWSLWVTGGSRIVPDVPSMVEPDRVAKMPVGDACIAASTIATPTAAWSLWNADQRVSVRNSLLENPRIGEPTALVGFRWLVARGAPVPFHLGARLGADTVVELLRASEPDDVRFHPDDIEAWSDLVGVDAAVSLPAQWADPLVFHWLDRSNGALLGQRWQRCGPRRRAAYAEHTLVTAARRGGDLVPVSILTVERCELFTGMLGDLHPERVGDRDTPLTIEDLDAFARIVDGAAISAGGISVLMQLEARTWLTRGLGFSFAGRIADLAAAALTSDALAPGNDAEAAWLCARVSPTGADTLLSVAARSSATHPIRGRLVELLGRELPSPMVADTLAELSRGHSSDPFSATRRWARGGFSNNPVSSAVLDVLWERVAHRDGLLAAVAPAYESWWHRSDICERVAADDATLSVLVAAAPPAEVTAAVAAPFGDDAPPAPFGPAASLIDALNTKRIRGSLTAAALLNHVELAADVAPRVAVAAGTVETFISGGFAVNPLTDASFDSVPSASWLRDWSSSSQVFANVAANRALSPELRLDAAMFAAGPESTGTPIDCSIAFDETLRVCSAGERIVDLVTAGTPGIVGCWLAGHYCDCPTGTQLDVVLDALSGSRSRHGLLDVVERYAVARAAAADQAVDSDRVHRWVADLPGVFTMTHGEHLTEIWGLFVDIALAGLGTAPVRWRLFCELGEGSEGSLRDVLDLVAAAG